MEYEIRKVNTDEFDMEYLVFGNGPKKLVIIPGLSITSVLKSAKDIREHYSMFCDEYTVYLFDRRKDIFEGYNTYMIREDTYKAMKCEGIEHAYMFGASQGGMITMIIAITHPEFPVKIAVGSSVRSLDGVYRESSDWMAAAETGDIKSLSLAFMKSVYTNGDRILEMAKDMPREMFGTEEDVERFKINYRANTEYDIRDRLGEIKCPVLAIGGRKDIVAKWEESEEIAKRTGGESYIYEEYGHAAYDEASDYKDRLKTFFDK